MIHQLNIILKPGMPTEHFEEWRLLASQDKDVFLKFWAIAQDTSEKYAWRALWVIEHAIIKQDHLLDIIISDLQILVLHSQNNSILRIGLKLICKRPIPNTDIAGHLLSKCETLLLDTKVPIATRANALLFFYEFCKVERALSNELILIIEHLESYESSAGMKARFRMIKKEFSKWS